MSKSTEDLLRELEAENVLQRSSAMVPSPPRPLVRRRKSSGPGTLWLLLAVVIIAVIGSLPFGSYALYPFALFVTLLHESGHALAATLTGGTVLQLRISPNLSGVTTFVGGLQALIAPAGYLGATLAGVALLLVPVRFSRWVLTTLAAVPLAALLVFHPANLFTAGWSLVFAAALGLAAWKLSPRWAAFLQIFLGVEAGLNAFRDILTLLFISSTNGHLWSDAQAMSQALFFPPMVWAVLWTVLSMILLIGALLVLVRRDVAGFRLKSPKQSAST